MLRQQVAQDDGGGRFVGRVARFQSINQLVNALVPDADFRCDLNVGSNTLDEVADAAVDFLAQRLGEERSRFVLCR